MFRLFAPLLAFSLAACSGTMQGVVRGTGEPVAFSFEQGIDSDKYTAIVGKESFAGKAVMDGASSTQAILFGANGFGQAFGQTSTNRFVAVLLGNRGSTLNCQMRYADSSGLTTSGGVGVCQHSDGRVIDVLW